MRTSKHTVRCSECPAQISLEITGLSWATGVDAALVRFAVYAGWSPDGKQCPVHKPKPP